MKREEEGRGWGLPEHRCRRPSSPAQRKDHSIEDEPAHKTNKYVTWKEDNSIVMDWIMNSVQPHIASGLCYYRTAKRMLEYLLKTYSHDKNVSQILQVEQEIFKLQQGVVDVDHSSLPMGEEVAEALEAITDQLAASGNNISDKEKVQQTLNGLRHDYHAFITALEVLPVLPSFNELQGKLLQHEMNMKRVIVRTDHGNSQNVLAMNVKFGKSHGNSNHGGRGILLTPHNQAAAHLLLARFCLDVRLVMADKGKEVLPHTGSDNIQSSNSSVHTTAVEKDNPEQPLWNYVKKIGKGPGGGGNVMFACNFCQKRFTGSYTRCKAHLLHIGGIGIRPCQKLTNEDIKILKKEQDAAEKKSSSKSSVLVPLFASEQQEDASKKRKSTLSLTHAFNNMGRAEMDRRIGRFFYASSLPFNVARSPYWKDVVTGLANCNLGGYVPPSSEKLRTVILAEEKANIEKLLEKKKFSWTQYGVSIVSDGWTNIQRRPLINFIAYSLNGPIFLKCIDASGEYKDVEYLKRLFVEVIKEVGEENVVQIVTDNAPVCQRAGMNFVTPRTFDTQTFFFLPKHKASRRDDNHSRGY
ncbi:hypothetical protein EJ110_NYTH59873 [Nymphaea thermarum]|nr:hypothetical protein EJ110_NYTH59873 [Nymphaea thermarum]